MALSTFQGPVRSLGGFYTQGPNNIVTLANGTNTITLTVADHAGRFIVTNDATLVITLPTIVTTAYANGTGPGADPNSLNNLGAEFMVYVDTTATAWVLKTDGTDKFVGSISLFATDAAGATTSYAPAAANDCINFNGTTTGGVAGSWVRVRAIATAKYFVQGLVNASGAVATPFADS